MKINTKQVLTGFDSKPLPSENGDLTVSAVISKCLGAEKSPDPLKAFILAQKFYTQDEVEVDASDKIFIKEAMRSSQFWTPLVIGQILIILDEAK